MKLDLTKFIDGLHGWLGEQFAPIVKRLKVLEDRPQINEAVITENVTKALDQRFQELYELTGTIQTSVKEISLTPGPKGEDGAPGKDGEPGSNGADAVVDPDQLREIVLAEVQVASGVMLEDVRKAMAQMVSDLPPPAPGEPGQPGKDAEIPESLIRELIDARVKEIPAPADGKSVPIEDVQRMIDEAVEKRMADIRMPKDGEPGRDGLHLEILPAIDDQKSYPRGTYAKHLGGLWRAYETTHGMKGWECIVNGVAGVEYEPSDEDPRVLAAKTVLSDGTESCAVIRVPAMFYKGVFREGEEYDQGDTVTWGGSLWHCQETTRDKPAETGTKAWKLAVKRGANGKDGRDGIDHTAAVRLT